MWEMQQALLTYAEHLFGPRSTQKNLCQPDFDEDGPFVRHTPSFDGAFADLSYGSKSSWSCAFYELAHETVHLLDPRGDRSPLPSASFLEEAIATSFATNCQMIAGVTPSPHKGNYSLAIEFAQKLGRDLNEVGKDIRQKHGHFSTVTASQLMEIAPECPEEAAKWLTSDFPGRGY